MTTKGNDAGSGEGSVTRFLIFIGLFPGIAVAVLIAFVAVGAGSLPDKRTAFELAGWGYAVGIIPALICAAVDLLLRNTRIPPVIATALVATDLRLWLLRRCLTGAILEWLWRSA